jgi:hypothetical protein
MTKCAGRWYKSGNYFTREPRLQLIQKIIPTDHRRDDFLVLQMGLNEKELNIWVQANTFTLMR